MSDSKDARWKTGAAPIEGLAEAMLALSTAHASDAELGRLRAAIAPQLAAPTQSLGDAGANALSPLSAWRAWPWLSVVVIGFGALWMFASHDSQPAAERKVLAPHAIVAPQTIVHELPQALSTPNATPPLALLRAPNGARTAVKRKAPAAVEEPSAVLSPDAELVLLRKAQSALNRSASAALELANEHARSYPNGLFAQEREMLRIEAELMLGQRREALTRAHDFSERFGRSTYRARIDRLLASHRALKDRETDLPASTQ